MIAVVTQHLVEGQARPLLADLAQSLDLFSELLQQHVEGHLQLIGFGLQPRSGIEEELQRPTAQEREPVAELLQELGQLPELAEYGVRGGNR